MYAIIDLSVRLGLFFTLVITLLPPQCHAHMPLLQPHSVSPFCSTTTSNQIPVFHRRKHHRRHRRRPNKRLTAVNDGPGVRRSEDTVLELFEADVDNAKSDNEFLVRMQLGTPAQSFWAVPDSGTPQTWVYGPKCCYHNNHSFFHPSKSTTFHPLPVAGFDSLGKNTSTSSYGTGLTALTLQMASDVLTVPRTHDEAGHASLAPLRINAQEFGIVEVNEDPDQLYRKMEGLLGFAPSGASLFTTTSTSHLTPMENWIKQGSLRKPMVSFTFVKHKHASREHQGGRLTIGGVDEEAVDGEVMWIPSNSSVYWATHIGKDTLKIGEKDLYGINETMPKKVIFDTGSAVIYLPDQIATYANAMLTGAFKTKLSQKWVIPCEYGTVKGKKTKGKQHRLAKPMAKDVEGEVFTVRLGDRAFRIPSEDLVSFPDEPWAFDTATGQKYCLTSIQSGPNAFAVLGNTFIKNHAFTLDYGDGTATGRRVGIANRKDV